MVCQMMTKAMEKIKWKGGISMPSIFAYLFLAELHGMQDPSSLTRNWTHAPYIWSMDF